MTPSVPSTTMSASSVISAGPSSERTPTRIAFERRPSLASDTRAWNASRSVDVVADVHRRVDVGVGEKRRDAGSFVDPHRRTHLEHLPPPVRAQPSGLCLGRDRVDRRTRGLLVGRATPVEGDDRALVLEADPESAQVRGVGLARELVDPLGPIQDRGIHHRLGPTGAQHLGAVRAEVRDRADRDHRPRLRGPAAADARDHAVPPGDLREQRTRRLGHSGIAGVIDDRGERAVDVEHDRGAGRIGAERRDGVGQKR